MNPTSKGSNPKTLFNINFFKVNINSNVKDIPIFYETLDESKPAADSLVIDDFKICKIKSVSLFRNDLKDISFVKLLSFAGKINIKKVHRYEHFIINDKICQILITPCKYYNQETKYKTFDLITILGNQPNYHIINSYNDILKNKLTNDYQTENLYTWIGQNNSKTLNETVDIYLFTYDLEEDFININNINLTSIWNYLTNLKKAFIKNYNSIPSKEL